MMLYIDDDGASPRLASLLRQAGHNVVLPVDVGMAGKKDAVHFVFAIRASRVLLTRNYSDFDDLHDLAMALGGHYPGLLTVRMDSDPKRDMKFHEIVRAIGNLLAAGVTIVDHNHILNHWR
jgi:predicted nuclease of predicted toxin-antitoxin system